MPLLPMWTWVAALLALLAAPARAAAEEAKGVVFILDELKNNTMHVRWNEVCPSGIDRVFLRETPGGRTRRRGGA